VSAAADTATLTLPEPSAPSRLSPSSSRSEALSPMSSVRRVAQSSISSVASVAAWADRFRSRVASQVRWKIGDGRRLLVMMLGGGCDGFGAGGGGLRLGLVVEELAA
jgi:hypothetical protein